MENFDPDSVLFVGKRRDFLRSVAGLSLASCLGALPDIAGANAKAGLQLQQLVNGYIKKLRRSGRVEVNERTAWSVFDFTTRQKLVSINENTPYQSASMIKPFIAQAYFYRHLENPRLYPYDEATRALMERMIRYSDNRATNAFISRISDRPPRHKPKDVERLLKRHAGGVFRHTSIVEYIPKSGRSYRNKAAARDYSRFLYALWHQRLPYAEELKNHMALVNADRIKQGCDVIPPATQIYDKTGSTARLCGNMGIVVAYGRDGKTYPYTFIGIIERASRARAYTPWLRDRSDVIREVSGLVYQALKARHQLI